ncbi:hypothetical protein ScalyP_jg3152 [Parmales sp. scaly parma]|nr:hypothetical protein ScalyP_jg3152 [Parmales sp. scaly parma]
MLLLALLLVTACGQQLYDQPVIGILTYPSNSSSPFSSYFDASYVKWIEQSGARVAPIRFDMQDMQPNELELLFSKINGVLFTGGPGQPEDNNSYFSTAKQLYKMVIESSDYVPLWGTCLGFETIASLVGGGEEAVLTAFDAEKLSLPLTFEPDTKISKLFNPASTPKNILETFQKLNVTTHWHDFGVSITNFDEKLRPNNLRSLTTNLDRSGFEFVSTLEHVNKPVYATQWHPEANQFDTTEKKGDGTPNRIPQATFAMQYLSSFMISEARKNQHSFANPDDFANSVLGAANEEKYVNDGFVYNFR